MYLYNCVENIVEYVPAWHPLFRLSVTNTTIDATGPGHNVDTQCSIFVQRSHIFLHDEVFFEKKDKNITECYSAKSRKGISVRC